jgi:putative ABC transport system permease protein
MAGLNNPVGGNISYGSRYPGKIIGVVKDFHFSSFANKIGPIAFRLRPLWAAKVLSVKTANRDINKTLDFINQTFQKHINGFVFNYSFLDDNYNSLYNPEEKMGTLFLLFTIVAISIASSGLFGLITFAASQKTKEIGIRKILGASITKIIALMVKEFAVMVVVSSLIALPAAYYIMNRWLQGFAYRTYISIEIMLISLLITSVITILSVSFQVIKAARINPADSLRYE